MIRVEVRNVVSGSSLKMEIEPKEKISDIIDSAAEFWKKDPAAYVLKRGKVLLRGNMTALEANLVNDDVLELIPDPEGGNGTS